MCGHLCCVLCADLGTESVSGTLSSLQQCQPQDSFDVFAQTRGSALAEQRNPYAGALLMALGTLGGWPWPGLMASTAGPLIRRGQDFTLWLLEPGWRD